VRMPPDVHQPVHIELHFSARTGHLVGTRNGTPIWMARGTVAASQSSSCPP
jgi:hypothetical protein